MSDLLLMLGVFAATFAIGYALISKVPPMLHTPLMSMTNAISAVTVLAALLLFAAPLDATNAWLGAIAIAAAMFNVVGGFVITDRMLGMFRRREPEA
ncbi:MAG TPA: NAD(P) transhydrogenase subunit alpha [Phycisphaerae bacterium]|nr:NAD(P) transhydrogenase subunit alpha [Phycisphaerae bacterium]